MTPATPVERALKTIMIIGAGSAIARAVARRYAETGCRLFLVARDADVLHELKQDLLLRGAETVDTATLDVNDTEMHRTVVASAAQGLGTVDLALICHGVLPDQTDCEHDFPLITETMNTNAMATISLLCELAPLMKKQAQGTLAVITSVAGDRGRASNYVYAASKAAVSTYLQGLRASLFRDGVHVTDIRPGFVDTPMTASFNKGLLWAQPEQVAAAIVRGLERKKHILYTPWFWRWIMLIIRSIPEPLFKRMKL